MVALSHERTEEFVCCSKDGVCVKVIAGKTTSMTIKINTTGAKVQFFEGRIALKGP